jgi:predicted DNA-binding protein (MmcQ/YjbR family)
MKDNSPVIWVGLIAAITPIITAILVARFERIRYQTQKLREDLNSDKKEFYIDLIGTLQKLFDDEWDEVVEKQTSTEKMKELLQKAYYYSSTDVLRSLADLMQHFYITSEKEQEETDFILRAKKLLAELIVQIRKDLGHANFMNSENWLDILRLNIKDISEYVHESYRKDKGKKTYPSMLFGKKRIK